MKHIMTRGGVFLTTAVLAAMMACGATDYVQLARGVRNLQTNPHDATALNILLDAAKSDDYDVVVSRCMAIYTLWAGLDANDDLCRKAYQSLETRYPRSEITRLLKALNFLPTVCPQCAGAGKVTVSDQIRCSFCKGTGKRLESKNKVACPYCKGTAQRTVEKRIPCPTCQGVVRHVDRQKAQLGFNQVVEELEGRLKTAVACRADCDKALTVATSRERMAALMACREAYPDAFNRDILEKALRQESKAAQTLKLMQMKQAAEEMRRKQTVADEAVLGSIRQMASAKGALGEITAFLEKHPDSPVLEQARILKTEIENRRQAEWKAEQVRRWLWMVGGAVAGAVGIAWLIVFIRINRPQRVEIRRITPATAGAPDTFMGFHEEKVEPLTLVAATAATPEARLVFCPACGAKLGNPTKVVHQVVLCGVCHQRFHVN